ncbi:la-related protein 4 isoform X1 [Gadus chalcogrammus]|uniref:la-related protein 4 isoform X1 n=1 Tax=Gadus chalcogrammus TaxID=1042646 RepID=UPI0024C4675C|nr:la-related protein 4 isoform X1 [Gadus chalcogrammus]
MSSDQGGEPPLLQEEADPGPATGGKDEAPLGTEEGSGGMVTSKGVGLNPNAKVWQEIPVVSSEVSADATPWSPSDVNDAYSESSGCKPYAVGFTALDEGLPTDTTEVMVNGMDPPELGFSPAESITGTSVEPKAEEPPVSSENLRESLKKELEFYFSRENLSKDLYLMSQMDSDQFVPVWTIASMEGIKALTTDMDLILDVLRTSPMVQVDEKGEKVRPNHKRCIIILREVPETTPVEEVEALFKNENCPKVISVEFAHNNNWYITFQSDTDAQQGHKYLREEVKTFQGKPIMARIKAINTFFAKNGYRSMDNSMYAQPSQAQSQFNSPLYMQHIYPQQQYPVYGIVPPTWTQSPTPYFETPLAPFPNNSFVNGFGSAGHYKTGSNSLNMTRPFNRNRVPLYSRKNVINAFRNHVKPQGRTGEVAPASVTPVPLESLTGLRSPQPLSCVSNNTTSNHGNSHAQTPADLASAFPHLSAATSPLDLNDDGSMAGRGRRSTTYRGTRRRREDDRITRPAVPIEVKPSPPKFDLAANNFPPLPGCVVSTQGEPVLENRMSDVVRGLNRDKTEQPSKEAVVAAVPAHSPAVEEAPHVPSVSQSTHKPVAQPLGPPVLSAQRPEKKVERAEPLIPKAAVVVPAPPAVTTTSPASAQPVVAPRPQPTAAPTPVKTNTPSPATVTVAPPAQEPRKLSYAEVCQRPPIAPPPAAPAAPALAGPVSPPTAPGQPLRELRVNKAEEPGSSSGPEDKQERAHDREGGWECKESRPPRDRDGQGHYRRNGPRGTGALKFRDQRRPPPARRSSPQGGYRHTGKEQNIPPVSPK